MTGARLAAAAAAGMGAAVVGGLAWGLIVKWTNYEVGFVALGVGFIVGTAVVLAAGNRKGLPLQILAVVFALLGVAIGKYLAFVWSVEEQLAIDLPLLDGTTFDAFADRDNGIWGWFDLLWIAIAGYVAFRIPQPEREDAPVQTTPSE